MTLRTARILLVEADHEARRNLDWHLERAGHEVASVPDQDGARRLLEDGLEPDLIVSETELLEPLAPHVARLRIVATATAPIGAHEVPDDPTVCSRDPDEIVRRVEEVLLEASPRDAVEPALACLDLVRRLCGALPSLRSTEARCDLVTEAFDTYFGVRGSLVVRRGAKFGAWLEAAQGLDAPLAHRVSAELFQRTRGRGLRPFLTRIELDGRAHEVAGLAIQGGADETDLALVLERPPPTPGLRESLVSLVGSTLRAAMANDELERTRALLEARTRSLGSLHEMSHAFTRIGSRRLLGEEILRATHRELQMSRSALFLRRDEHDGLLSPLATAGLTPQALDRIGLSTQHGVGARCLESSGVVRLPGLAPEGLTGLTGRELQRLSEAGLQWAMPLRSDEGALGILFFGNREDASELDVREFQALESLSEASASALRQLQRAERIRDLALAATHGLVAALEIRYPADKGHAHRVARSAVAVGRAMALPPADLRDLALAGLLHDVGKLAIPADSAEDGDPRRLRMHPMLGSRILSRCRPAAGVLQGVEQHHERFDGAGFPYGLKGESIHLNGRILAVADSWDHWAQDGAEASERALRRLEVAAGLLFDPGLVALFCAEVVRGATAGAGPAGDDWLEEVLAVP